MEILLTKEDINEILQSVMYNPILSDPNILFIDSGNKNGVMRISPKNKLILIYGDEYTGFTHIHNRHSYWSQETYWKKNDINKLDTPSKFEKTSIPIKDYIEIIDDLYCQENINLENNNNPELFDLYFGNASSTNLKDTKYKMLLYKGTKIVHTLYPTSAKHNKKKILDYRRGKPKGQQEKTHTIIAVPYYDKDNKVIISFELIWVKETKMRYHIIINHLNNKWITLYEKPFSDYIDYDSIIQDMEYEDLSKVEKIIKEHLL